MAVEDPRPLTGEPLALDLVNTAWVSDGVPQDLLAQPGGAALWLRTAGHPDARPWPTAPMPPR